MHYIVGLGNPGEEYEHTRHNVGFMFVERFLEDAQLPVPHHSGTYNGLISEGVFAGEEVVVLLPHTYMNASGGAVAKLLQKNEADKLIVVYDEVDLPLGEMKVSYGRGDGGHNGIKSIIEKLGTKDFTRVRIGIGGKSMWTGKPVRPTGDKLAAYVLKQFSAKEIRTLETLHEPFFKLLTTFVQKGKDAAMNAHN